MKTMQNTMFTSASNCTFAAGTFVCARIIVDAALLAVSIIIIIIIPLIALLEVLT